MTGYYEYDEGKDFVVFVELDGERLTIPLNGRDYESVAQSHFREGGGTGTLRWKEGITTFGGRHWYTS